jgi:hypothetical protein
MRNLWTLLVLTTLALVLATGAMAEESVNEPVVNAEPATEPASSPEELLPANPCGSEEDKALPGNFLALGNTGFPIGGEVLANPQCEGLCRCGGILGGCCQCPKGSTSGSCCADGACTIEGDPICFAVGSCTCISTDPD